MQHICFRRWSASRRRARRSPCRQPCREAAASFALGETYTDRLARQARRAAEARLVRKVEPGRSHTMEFRADRLNLDVNGRGTVLAVRCG